MFLNYFFLSFRVYRTFRATRASIYSSFLLFSSKRNCSVSSRDNTHLFLAAIFMKISMQCLQDKSLWQLAITVTLVFGNWICDFLTYSEDKYSHIFWPLLSYKIKSIVAHIQKWLYMCSTFLQRMLQMHLYMFHILVENTVNVFIPVPLLRS